MQQDSTFIRYEERCSQIRGQCQRLGGCPVGVPNKVPPSIITYYCEPRSFLNPSSSPHSLSDLGVQTFSNSQHDNEILGAVPERYSPAENFTSHPAQAVKLRNLCRVTLFATEPL